MKQTDRSHEELQKVKDFQRQKGVGIRRFCETKKNPTGSLPQGHFPSGDGRGPSGR